MIRGVILIIGILMLITAVSAGSVVTRTFTFNDVTYVCTISTSENWTSPPEYPSPSYGCVNQHTGLTSAWEPTFANGAPETDIIDMWYSAGAVGSRVVYYVNTTNHTMTTWNTSILTDVPTGYGHFPYIVYDSDTSKYYMFADKASGSSWDIYLFNSTNKVNWNIMNAGDPVFTHSSNNSVTYSWLANAAIWIENSSRWHMILECGAIASPGTGGVIYSYSNLTEMNWTAHVNSTFIFENLGNPDLVYVPDRNSLMMFAGKWVTSPSLNWEIDGWYTDVSSGLSSTSSWTFMDGVEFSRSGVGETDPAMIVHTTPNDIIGMSWLSGQATNPLIKTSDISLNDFFDWVSINESVVWGSVC